MGQNLLTIFCTSFRAARFNSPRHNYQKWYLVVYVKQVPFTSPWWTSITPAIKATMHWSVTDNIQVTCLHHNCSTSFYGYWHYRFSRPRS